MPASTLAEAQAIAHDVAAILDPIMLTIDQHADRSLAAQRGAAAREWRQMVEELSRQADRLRDI